jgi:hypothetical protein
MLQFRFYRDVTGKKTKEKPMKHMNYSSITAMLRRIHRAKAISDETGVPAKELME